jgi:hypothetical protein
MKDQPNKHHILHDISETFHTVSPSPIDVIPTKKKIGFVSAISLVIGSSIGAGIFIKNHEILNNVHGSIFLALLS